jgi:glutathione S-transferase
VLYQFPISHYCEKARWILESKGLAYRTRNLPPGAHAPYLRRLARVTTVPVLIDRGRVVPDSTNIALHLDATYAERPLLPADPAERARVLEIEEWLDRDAGPAIRRYIYGELMRDPGGAARAFWGQYPRWAQTLGGWAGSLFERVLRRQLRIDDEALRKDRATILECFDRLDALLEGDPNRMLVGPALTLADITAASLLGPMLLPPESPWADATVAVPPVLAALRESIAQRVSGRWVLERYRRDRRA